jgi:hypothetical protein
MSKAVQRRRGTTAEHTTFTGALGELTVDTTKDTIVVHDGAVAGGYPLLREDGSNSALALGSAGTPSLKWDADTGIYSPGADQVAISTNGTGRLFIDASGSVSINTQQANVNSPLTLLASGIQGLTISRFGSSFGTGLFTTAAAGTEASPTALGGATTGRWEGAGYDGTSYRTTARISFSSEGTVTNTSSPGTITFHTTGSGSTSSTERLRIDSSGRLGLGTSSPAAGIHIATAGQTTSALDTAGSLNLLVTDTGASAGNGGSIVFGFNSGSGRFAAIKGQVITGAGNSTGHLTFATRNATGDSALTERLRITNDGLVGIGTTSPDALLTVNGVGAHGLGSVTAPSYAFTGDLNTGFWSPAADTIAASTGGSERARIDSSGRLLVGTSSDSQESTAVLQGSSSGTTFGSILRMARGSSTPTDGNTLGLLTFTDSGHTSAASVSAARDGGTWTSGSSQPTRLVFSTTADGAASPTERMRIDNAGTTTLTSAAATAPFIAKVSTTEAARIDSSGRLLVGTSTASVVRFGSNTAKIETNSGDYHLAMRTDNNASSAGFLTFIKTRSSAIVQNNDELGTFQWRGHDGTDVESVGASIGAFVDGTPGTNDMPGRLVFFTTPDGSAGPTERLRITSAGVLQVAEASNIAVGTTTGTKIGTATTQKLGFYNATPVVQPIAVADATDAASAITQLNALLARMRDLGLIAT